MFQVALNMSLNDKLEVELLNHFQLQKSMKYKFAKECVANLQVWIQILTQVESEMEFDILIGCCILNKFKLSF